MIWFFFIGGFLVGGVVAAILIIRWFMRWINGETHGPVPTMAPTRHEIHSRKALQAHLGRVLRTADSRRANYLSRIPDGLTVCVRRYARKSKADALVVDVPRSVNPEQYEQLREVLEARRIPFDEHVSPKRRTPKLMRVKFEDGEQGVAAQATEVICVLYQALHGEASLALALEYY